MSRRAYATLLTRESYLPGVLVLEHGMRYVNSRYPLVIMVTHTLPDEAKNILRRRGLTLVDVEKVTPEASRQPASFSSHDSRFSEVWSKLAVFGLTDYDRVVLLDADMIIRKNIDDLFDLEIPDGQIAAAHVCACNPAKLPYYPADWIPANCAHTAVKNPTAPAPIPTEFTPQPYKLFNSGLMVLNPNAGIFAALIDFMFTTDQLSEFTFGDQNLLNIFFEGKWKPLNWYYNALKPHRKVHPQMWDDDVVRVVHYIFPQKPWAARVPDDDPEGPYTVLHRWWWSEWEDVAKELKESDLDGWAYARLHVAS